MLGIQAEFTRSPMLHDKVITTAEALQLARRRLRQAFDEQDAKHKAYLDSRAELFAAETHVRNCEMALVRAVSDDHKETEAETPTKSAAATT